MEKPGTPQNEEARLEALFATKLLEKGKESLFDDLTVIVKTVFDVPVVAISLLERKRQYFKSFQGFERPETPRYISFCGHVVFQNAPMILPDADKIVRCADNPLFKFHRTSDSLLVSTNRRFLTSFLSREWFNDFRHKSTKL